MVFAIKFLRSLLDEGIYFLYSTVGRDYNHDYVHVVPVYDLIENKGRWISVRNSSKIRFEFRVGIVPLHEAYRLCRGALLSRKEAWNRFQSTLQKKEELHEVK